MFFESHYLNFEYSSAGNKNEIWSRRVAAISIQVSFVYPDLQKCFFFSPIRRFRWYYNDIVYKKNHTIRVTATNIKPLAVFHLANESVRFNRITRRNSGFFFYT